MVDALYRTLFVHAISITISNRVVHKLSNACIVKKGAWLILFSVLVPFLIYIYIWVVDSVDLLLGGAKLNPAVIMLSSTSFQGSFSF